MKLHEKYPGHGNSLLDLHDLLNGQDLDLLMGGMQKIIWNEIGKPITDFDQIVSIDTSAVPNFGILLASQFKIPHAKITQGKLPGESLTHEYGNNFKKKTLSIQNESIKPN